MEKGGGGKKKKKNESTFCWGGGEKPNNPNPIKREKKWSMNPFLLCFAGDVIVLSMQKKKTSQGLLPRKKNPSPPPPESERKKNIPSGTGKQKKEEGRQWLLQPGKRKGGQENCTPKKRGKADQTAPPPSGWMGDKKMLQVRGKGKKGDIGG